MPNNPQCSLGTTSIKYYNNARVARVEAMEWLHLVNKEGKSLKDPIIPYYHNKELQDYLNINVNIPSVSSTISNPSVPSNNPPPSTNITTPV